MKYEIVELKERRVVGVGVRTSNEAPDMVEKIGRVWADFLGGQWQKLTDRQDAPLLGLYTNYDWADGSYDMLAAAESDVCPDGFRAVTIPGGKYAKFTFRGNVQEATAKAWAEVWQEPLARAFQVDFEEYGQPDEQHEADISIYLGLADLCQSCAMPMTDPKQHGTEADGTPSGEYCCYCRQKGIFTAACTMEQMIDFCLDNEEGKKLYKDRAKAKAQMMAYFPTLKRWKQ